MGERGGARTCELSDREREERTPAVVVTVLLWPGLAGSAWNGRQRSDNLHLLRETERAVQEDRAHPVHVRLCGEPAPTVAVRPLLGLSLDHPDELLATPTLAAGERVDVSSFPRFFFRASHSQIVRVVRHLDRLPHDGLFTAVDRSRLERHRRHGVSGGHGGGGGGHRGRGRGRGRGDGTGWRERTDGGAPLSCCGCVASSSSSSVRSVLSEGEYMGWPMYFRSRGHQRRVT